MKKDYWIAYGFPWTGFRGGVCVCAPKKHSADLCNILVRIMFCRQRVFLPPGGFFEKTLARLSAAARR